MKINDYILVHGKIINIKNNIDDKYIWFDIVKDEYFKDKDGNLKNYPSFFSARIPKTINIFLVNPTTILYLLQVSVDYYTHLLAIYMFYHYIYNFLFLLQIQKKCILNTDRYFP